MTRHPKPETPHFAIGDTVDYHSIIGEPATQLGLTVADGPFDTCGTLTWKLAGKAGVVAQRALTRSRELAQPVDFSERHGAAPKCQCTHEQGDSDCAVHPSCPECGMLLVGTNAYRQVRAERDALTAQLAAAIAERDEAVRVIQRESAWVNERNGVIAFLSGALAEVQKAKSISSAKTFAVVAEMTLAEWHAGTWQPGPGDDLANLRDGVDEPVLDELEQAIADREIAWARLADAEAERDEARAEREKALHDADYVAMEVQNTRATVEAWRGVVEAAKVWREEYRIWADGNGDVPWHERMARAVDALLAAEGKQP